MELWDLQPVSLDSPFFQLPKGEILGRMFSEAHGIGCGCNLPIGRTMCMILELLFKSSSHAFGAIWTVYLQDNKPGTLMLRVDRVNMSVSSQEFTCTCNRGYVSSAERQPKTRTISILHTSYKHEEGKIAHPYMYEGAAWSSTCSRKEM